MVIAADTLTYTELNRRVKESDGEVEITGCLGQRFIGAGLSEKKIRIRGVPGNALGAYLNGAEIEVFGNAQDAVGDTMNRGRIVVHGNIGDAAGYSMRGGALYIRGNAGYRAGVHMKAYGDKRPVMVIGGRAGSFLGEYQAGGYIIVLGRHTDCRPIVGRFPCTGMHGGKVFLRATPDSFLVPEQVTVSPATAEDMEEIREYLETYCSLFGVDSAELLASPFSVIAPDSKNPYRQMYVAN